MHSLPTHWFKVSENNALEAKISFKYVNTFLGQDIPDPGQRVRIYAHNLPNSESFDEVLRQSKSEHKRNHGKYTPPTQSDKN